MFVPHIDVCSDQAVVAGGRIEHHNAKAVSPSRLVVFPLPPPFTVFRVFVVHPFNPGLRHHQLDHLAAHR